MGKGGIDMAFNFHFGLIGTVRTIVRTIVSQFSAINRKYSTPQIQMSANVKFALLLLRLYLIFLVMLLAYKFYTMIGH